MQQTRQLRLSKNNKLRKKKISNKLQILVKRKNQNFLNSNSQKNRKQLKKCLLKKSQKKKIS